jgi:hypothetical protein
MKRSNSKIGNKENYQDEDVEMSQWNDSDKHLIHLRADRIIGSGSFGKL